jgi:hypothetical protein
MKCSGWSSRAISVCSAGLVALGVAGPALGHVIAVRPYVEAAASGEIELETPNERKLPMTGFVVIVPDGFRIVGARSSEDWSAVADRTTATWRGGSLPANALTTFTLEVDAPSEPGPTALRSEQHYPDGGVVRWNVPLTVTPAGDSPAQNLGWALVVGALGLLVLGLIGVLAWRRGGRPAAG